MENGERRYKSSLPILLRFELPLDKHRHNYHYGRVPVGKDGRRAGVGYSHGEEVLLARAVLAQVFDVEGNFTRSIVGHGRERSLHSAYFIRVGRYRHHRVCPDKTGDTCPLASDALDAAEGSQEIRGKDPDFVAGHRYELFEVGRIALNQLGQEGYPAEAEDCLFIGQGEVELSFPGYQADQRA